MPMVAITPLLTLVSLVRDNPLVHDPAMFTDDANWTGGFYELALEVGDASDERLQLALSALWRAAGIEGCYRFLDREPGEQDEIACTVASLTESGHLRGTVRLPSGHRIVCGCVAFRGDGDPDWLDFYLPLEALCRVDQRIGGFPFDQDSGRESLAWRRPLDDWLAVIGTDIFHDVGFRLGLIGFEIAGDTQALPLDGAAPEQRWAGYLLPAGGTLRYEPANR